MDERQEIATEVPRAAVEPVTTTGRREFVARLAKAAIVPAVVIGVAANISTAHATY